MKLFILLFSVMIFSVIIIPISAEIPSPYKQLEAGIALEQIACNDGKILLKSPRGMPACLTFASAERLVDRGYIKIIPTNQEQSNDHTTKPDKKIIIKEISNSSNITEPQEIDSNEVTSLMQQQIPVYGYSVPIIDYDVFIEHFLSAADDKLKAEKPSNSLHTTVYDSVNGTLKITDKPVMVSSGPFASVRYYNHNQGFFETLDQINFINNFMNKMGFKLAGEDFMLTESMIERCSTYGYQPNCPDVGIYQYDTKYSTEYKFVQDYSKIHFKFNNKAFMQYGSLVTLIKFDGWINQPDLIEFTLDEEIAKKIAYDYALNNEMLHKSHRDGGKCEYIMFAQFLEHEKYRPIPKGFSIPDYIPKDRVGKTVVSDVPYYHIANGDCTYDPTGTGHFYNYHIFVEGLTGDSVYAVPVSYE